MMQHYVVEKSFESKVELLVLPKNKEASEPNDANIRLNIQLMNTYMNIMKSQKTIDEVKQNLKLKDSLDMMQKNMTISSDENSLSVNLKVTSNTMQKSKDIANGIAEVTQAKMKEYFPDNQVVILNSATDGILISKKMDYLIAGFMGLWVGILFPLIEIMIARVVRVETDLQVFDFPVLGSIAYSMEERKKKRGKK